MKLLRRYLIPSCIAAVLIICVAEGWRKFMRSTSDKAAAVPLDGETIVLPHGRVFYAVVEREGVYVGDQFIAFSEFNQFLRQQRDAFHASYAIVSGTESAKYGGVATTYASIREVLRVPATIETIVVSPGTRRPAIAVRQHSWEY